MRAASDLQWQPALLSALLFCGCSGVGVFGGGDGTGAGDGKGGETGSGSGTAPAPQFPGAGGTQPFGEGGTLECFYGPDNKTTPAAAVEYVIETVGGQSALRTRLSLNPEFADNTYGANAVGWSGKRGHTMEMLVRSDHAQILFANSTAAATPFLDIKIDYISAVGSGFQSLGITGGDGAILAGSAADVLQTNTSLNRNLNELGYGAYTVDSPATDAQYTPNVDAPNWDFRMVYEAWIRADAFSPSGAGRAFIDHIHASPAKTIDTIYVTPGPCPPEWKNPDSKQPGGAPCTMNSQCASLTCVDKVCFGEGGGGGTTNGLPGGSTCTQNIECQSLTCTAGVCINEGGSGGNGLPAGSTCSQNDQCQSKSCVNGVCINEGGDGTGPTPGPLPGGSVCSLNMHCKSLSCVNGTCLQEAGGGGTALPGGSACSVNAQCASASCENGVCLNEGGTGGTGLPGGSTCSTNAECLSLTCSGGVCLHEGGFPNGSPCTTNAECASLTCVGGVCGTIIN